MTEEFSTLLQALPPALRHEIRRMQEGQVDFYARLFEIRLRAGRHAALTFAGRNLLLPSVLTAAEIKNTLAALCGGSLYAHAQSLRRGYLSAYGFRIGVGGRAVLEGGEIIGVSDVTSLVIRIPHPVRGAGDAALTLFRELGGRRGILVYSPPGVGKTTLLSDLARSLSLGAQGMRVALIDTRRELYRPDTPALCQIDVLSDYPMAAGIELATRTLSPEVIICDEIGNEREARAVLATLGAGVPVIASAHAATREELYTRLPIRMLLDGGTFGGLIGIARKEGEYCYEVTRVS